MSRARPLTFALVLLPALALAQSRPPELSPSALPETNALAEPAPKLDTRAPRPERMLLEAMGGTAAAVAFGVAGGATGLLIGCPSGFDHSPSCLRGIAFGALAGVAIGGPPGVFLTGHLLHGGGAFIPTYLGGLVGIGAVLLLAPYTAGILPLLVFGLPVVGSVAGYELSASWHQSPVPPPVSLSAAQGGGAVVWTFSL